MKPQLLDTHILQWYLTGDKSLHAHIRNDIDYFANSYRVSIETLKELVVLRGLRKIEAHLTLEYVLRRMLDRNIMIEPVTLDHVLQLERLPPVTDITDIYRNQHRDPVDRMLVAQAISMRYTLVSSDHFFTYYEIHGLDWLNGKS
jgi:PIN domain nuclease of toxin-antitoxin system